MSLTNALHRLRTAEGTAAAVEQEIVMRSVIRLTRCNGGRGVSHTVWSHPCRVSPITCLADASHDDGKATSVLLTHRVLDDDDEEEEEEDEDDMDLLATQSNLGAPGSERCVHVRTAAATARTPSHYSVFGNTHVKSPAVVAMTPGILVGVMVPLALLSLLSSP